jgi:hypothetical protein
MGAQITAMVMEVTAMEVMVMEVTIMEIAMGVMVTVMEAVKMMKYNHTLKRRPTVKITD